MTQPADARVINPSVAMEEKKTCLLRIRRTKRTRKNIIVHAIITPNAKVEYNLLFFELSDKELVTAVEDAMPPIAPVNPIPFLVPSILIRT